MHLYIHIPFCASFCSYCDFYSVKLLSLREKYVEALCREIASYAKYEGSAANTIYIAPSDRLYYYYVTPWSSIRGSSSKDRYTCNVRVYIDLIRKTTNFQESVRSFCNGWAAINIAWCLRYATDDYAKDLYNECKKALVFPLSINQGTIKQKIQIAILNLNFSTYRKFCKFLRILGR